MAYIAKDTRIHKTENHKMRCHNYILIACLCLSTETLWFDTVMINMPPSFSTRIKKKMNKYLLCAIFRAAYLCQ